MSSLKDIFSAAAESLRQGDPVLYVSVIASSGSTPRGEGAAMMVFPNGESIGTIGGGAVEFAAQKKAAVLLADKRSECACYILDRNEVEDLGMICGGDVTVYFQYLDPADKNNYEMMDYCSTAFNRYGSTWLVRRIQNEQVSGMGVYDSKGLHFTDCISEELLRKHLSSRTELIKGDVEYYIEPITFAGRVYVFGGGHVGQQLVPVLAHIGFSVTLYEDREKFADPELFPDASEIILGDFSKIDEKVKITEDDYVVIMTRGHQMDYELLAQTLLTPAYYIGCIGSRSKIAATKKRLADVGIDEEMFARVNTPIGLSIGAQTPEEIAISIAAEMIQKRAQKRQC